MNSSASNSLRLSVKVIANASRNEILGFVNGTWRLRIAAPPEKGKANKELIEFLSNQLKIGKDAVHIIKGHTSHNKIIGITGITQEELILKLSPHKI